ncbi:MAG: S-layer homology domain-containing protein, partial [Clostridia bacterium]|nr:S-layer homology domain-containing protein [Clostridia bacterium]
AVAWAKEAGVVKGITATTFEPDGKITREQLATMLFRFSSSAPVSVPERADLTPFSDDEKVSEWANEPLEWAVEAGLIKGTDGNRLAPDGDATREQFAAIIERYDGTFRLAYNKPALFSHYTEKEYPLVDDADVYVSTDGDDSADGSFGRPVASFARAAERVREIKAERPTGDIVVAFRAGDYGPTSVELTAEDSGSPEQRIVYCKYGDGDVVFNNGMSFEPESFSPISEEERSLFQPKAADKIKKVDISKLYELGLDEDGIYVFYSGDLCTKARYPDKYDDGSDHLFASAVTHDKTSLEITFELMHRRLAKYSEEQFGTMEIWGHIIRGYRKDTFKVAGYDPDTRILAIADWESSEFGVMRAEWAGVDGEGIDMCISNVPYELDHEHEIWIDPETETLYAYDPDETYFVPGPGTQLTMDRTDDVTLRGLTFRNATGRFISAAACHRVSLELCSFNGTGAIEGVYFSGDPEDRRMDLTVRECTFANSYGHALYVDGKNRDVKKFEQDTNVVFDNNLVRTGNILYDTWNAVHFYDCTHVSVTHNRFENLARGAVSFTRTTDLTVEYNDFDSAMQNSNDGGVIYTDWIVDARDLWVRYNYFGEVPEAGAGQMGLYLDEFTSGFEIYSNLFYNVRSACVFSLGRDNVFRDNAVINGACGWGTSTRVELDELYGSVEEAEARGCWGIKYGKRTWGDLLEKLNDPAYRAVAEEKWPEMLLIHLDYDNIDDPYLANNQVTYIKNNVYVNKTGETPTTDRKYELIYTTWENETAYTYDENPIYVNPTAGDYRIREGADFPDIHFELIGRY